MYETIKRYEELLRTALYTAAILALVKGLDGCKNHDHHIIAQTSPIAQGTVPCVRLRNTKNTQNTQNRPL